MDDGLIPKRYAKALFEVATERGVAEQLYDTMKQLDAAFAAEPALQPTLDNPFIADTDKTSLLVTAGGATGCKPMLADMLKLLARNGRLPMARAIALAYQSIYREAHHIHTVHITSASPLAPGALARIKEAMERHLGGEPMELTVDTDPALIGGFTVDIGNERLDASVSNELKQLRLTLLSNKNN